MKEFYAILGYTVPNFGKEKNGDSFLFEHLAEEDLLIAVVADGVSQQPCDWLASLTTCRALIDHFKRADTRKGIKERLLDSIAQTSREVAATEGKCYQMAATLSVVVCQKSSEDFYYANIGDSRIYSLYGGNLEQLTKDDVIIRKERYLTNAGVRVVDKPVLTKVIGQDYISFKIYEASMRAGETIVLATDGFYDARKAMFQKIMLEFGGASDFERGFVELIDQLKILRGDDLTAIAIKRN
ncbi:MAG: PP2C family protein-serine/threonine phosphatase [Janthinobacterium lividum]